MSHSTYNGAWEISDREIRDLLELEKSKDPLLIPPKDFDSQFHHRAVLYIKYVQIFTRLEEAYDQMVHPQKRRVLKLMLDGVMGRVLELKHSLVELEHSDYQYFDETLSDLKLAPANVEIPVPKFFRRDNQKAIKEREKMLETLQAAVADARAPPPKPEQSPMTVSEAIRIIQIHERARQGRLRAKFMADIRHQEQRERKRKEAHTKKPSRVDAAITIQRMVRGHLVRKHVRSKFANELVFVGMRMPPPLPKKEDPVLIAKKNMDLRRATQEQYEQQYQAALVNIRKKIRDVEGPDIKENMADQIRAWFIACRDQTGKFPDFPDAEDGGSKKIFAPADPSAAAATDEAPKGKSKGAKGGKGDKSSAKPAKAKGDDKKKGKKKGEDAGDDAEAQASKFTPLLEQATTSFAQQWKDNPADKANFYQKHDADIVKAAKLKEVEDELRVQVDELMRQELENLKAAVEKDKKKKGKKDKKGKKGKKGKGKKGKKGKKDKKGKKGKKGKKEKDMTSDRTVDSLFEELIKAGIAKRIAPVSMQDYCGHYLGKTMQQFKDPQPSVADVRRVVTEYCILPLGSQVVHETQPVHIKSALLAGPKGTGKKMLAYIVAHELGATFFDLTPSNTAGKYTEKKGVDGVDGMIHKVIKVAKAMQPSVIFIDDAASIFLKKKPKDDPFDCTRMKKELPKAMKSLSPGDRVIVIGADSNPFDTDMKGLTSVFQKILYVPKPDYGSRCMLWRTILAANGAQLPLDFDISSLAKISDGYTAGHMVAAARDVLTPRRVQLQAINPLCPEHLVPALARLEPVSLQEDAEFKAWFSKTPLGKRQNKTDGGDDIDAAGPKKKKAAKKKK